VLVLCELALGLGTDAPRRRIRTAAFGEAPLQVLQLSKELVVLDIRQRRTIEDVVFMGRAV
jgi:hypothetical protein